MIFFSFLFLFSLHFKCKILNRKFTINSNWVYSPLKKIKKENCGKNSKVVCTGLPEIKSIITIVVVIIIIIIDVFIFIVKFTLRRISTFDTIETAQFDWICLIIDRGFLVSNTFIHDKCNQLVEIYFNTT